MTEKLTFPERVAHVFSKIFASWKFSIFSLLYFIIGASLNRMHITHIDPELIVLNFGLSLLTFFVDLVLMMNQVRQTKMDRQKLDAIYKMEQNIMAAISRLNSNKKTKKKK